MLLDAVPVAARMHPDFTPPDHVPRIRYRFASCVFAETLEDAEDCVETGDGCPAGYALGGVTKTLDTGSPAEREYFRRMWDELDRAMRGSLTHMFAVWINGQSYSYIDDLLDGVPAVFHPLTR